MDGYRTLLIWSIILCLTQDYGSCANILDGPQNVTVLTGSNATFLCTVASGWRSISWYLKNVFIVTITPSETTVSPGYTIVTQNSTNSITGAFTTEITIVNVNKSNSGTVQCSSFSASFQEAYLSVQVKGSVQITGGNVIVTPNSTVSVTCRAEQWYPAPSITWQINNTLADTIYYSTSYTTDANDFVTALSSFRINPETDLSLTCLATVQTLPQPQSSTVNITVREQSPGGGSSLSRAAIILIAVFVSFGGLLLLLVIILLIVICCKRRKRKRESGYQSDAWKAPEKFDNNVWTIDRDGVGHRNIAYTPEPEPERQSYGYNDGNSFDLGSTSTGSSVSQVPGNRWLNNHPKSIRHVTHV
ncbi:immunoglobulin superfamily member 5 isoform X1 [Engystomops pustulosus]|uniref:immunoglobulin superfamily member 5 isoform X1 n=1 Tax=Engystomops pustulosus TaxID=76066 RepID=UPI003AFB2F0E